MIERETRTYAMIKDPELLPGMRPKACRHDGHGGDGGDGVQRYLLARGAGHPDQPAVSASTRTTPFSRRAATNSTWSSARSSGEQARPTCTVGTVSVESSEVLSRTSEARRRHPHRPQRQVPPAGIRDRRHAGQRGSHDRDQHGRSRHRHQTWRGRAPQSHFRAAS